MVLNLPKFTPEVAFVKPAGKRKPRAAKVIADREFVANEFIEEACEHLDEDATEAEQLAAAWQKSPERTIIALSRTGMSSAEIALKFGYSVDNPDFVSVYSSAKELCRLDACAPILDQLPDSYVVPVIDTDGVVKEVDIITKLKKAIKDALLRGTGDEIKFSVVKNLQFGIRAESGKIQPYTLKSLLGWTAEKVAQEKSRIHVEYAQSFPTRRTGLIEIERPLPPGLANAVAAATESDDSTESDD